MDLNLDNYSDIEIINLLHLPIKDTYTLPELKNNTLDHVKVILNTDDDVIGNKRDITNFFIKAFLRLAKNYDVKVNPFEMQEFESVKTGLLPPLEEGVCQLANPLASDVKTLLLPCVPSTILICPLSCA